MRFEAALTLLRAGKKVRRNYWMHEPMSYAIKKHLYIDENGTLNKFVLFPGLVENPSGEKLKLSGEDITAEDWEEAL